jgi:hypothetical protein
MAVVDFRERQLTLKLVYYGPPLSGKTTNLQWLHSRVDRLNRGRLMTLDTRDDRTLFFDLLPIFFKTSSLSFRLKVYTVPGQPLHDATRRVVLKGADGVAFVADSQLSKAQENNDSFHNLLDNLAELGMRRERLGMVIQYNKRDLADVIDHDEIVQFAQRTLEPTYLATALQGVGVFPTFFGLLEQTWRALDAELNLERGFKLSLEDFMVTLREHVGVSEADLDPTPLA